MGIEQFSVPSNAGAFLQSWEGWPVNGGLYDKVIDLREATCAELAAELRRRAELHDADPVSETASIAETLRNYDPQWAGVLRRMARRLEIDCDPSTLGSHA